MDKILFFDGECGLCNRTVQFVLSKEKNQNIQFSPLQSEFAKQFFIKNNFPTINLTTVFYYENGNLYQKSSAILKISKNLRFPFNLLSLGLIVPRFIRNLFYDIIAKNRHCWKSESCQINSKFNSRLLL